MAVTLPRILELIGNSADAIECAFLKAGESLSRGLETFGQIDSTMSALSEQLVGGSMAVVASSLDGLSGDLLAISAQLPEDLTTLTELVANNEAIAKRLERLLDNIRMMVIVSRLSSIEAVVFDNETMGLHSLTQEINRLTGDAQNHVSACAEAHAHIFDLLKGAVGLQANLDRDFTAKLVGVATELTDTFSIIRQRRDKTAEFLQHLKARSARISEAAGLALVSLQGGDNIRQRLEHVGEAVARIIALNDGDLGANPTVPDDARLDTMAMLCRLQTAQVDDAVSAFAAEAGSIEAALLILTRDTREIIGSSEDVFGDAGNGPQSFLDVFRGRLASAIDLVGTCEATRTTVASVIAELRTKLGDFQDTIAQLDRITMGIVMVGMNAGLKAARLGSPGRSYVVIAGELKRLADEIAKDAEALLPMFEGVRRQSAQLFRQAGGAQVKHVDRALVSIAGELASGSQRLDQCLTVLRTEGGTFDRDLKRAIMEFSRAVSMNEELLWASDFLRDMAEEVNPSGEKDTGGRDYVSAIVASRYTMEREREIHASLMTLPVAC